ncbi:MAG: hypothetical protein H2049_13255 [Porphyrobacter sp.]|nr:hypothetical protein [Porphyrobacter sp.]
MVVLQQSKIQVLDTNEIDFISGGFGGWWDFCSGWRPIGADPVDSGDEQEP